MAELERFLRELLQPLLALGLGAARPMGLALVFPIMTRAELGGVVRGALALALAVPTIWLSSGTIASIDTTSPMPLVLLILKEVLVGTLLGFLLGMPFWAIQAVGELIDTQRGVGNEMAGGTDPTTRAAGSVSSIFLGLTAMALFIAADGLRTVVSTLYGSYEAWPQASFGPRLTSDGALAVVAGLGGILRYGFLVAGPIIMLLLAIDLAVMLIGRSAPHLNSQDMAPTIKNVVFVVVIGLYATYLLSYMRGEFDSLVGLPERLREFGR